MFAGSGLVIKLVMAAGWLATGGMPVVLWVLLHKRVLSVLSLVGALAVVIPLKVWIYRQLIEKWTGGVDHQVVIIESIVPVALYVSGLGAGLLARKALSIEPSKTGHVL